MLAALEPTPPKVRLELALTIVTIMSQHEKFDNTPIAPVEFELPDAADKGRAFKFTLGHFDAKKL